MKDIDLVEILLVEDNPSDAEMTIRALRKNDIIHNILHLKDGLDALNFLFGRGNYAGRDISITPKVILLDLKMPKVGGIEVLTKIKETRALKHIPVFVLTSSKQDPAMRICLKLGAANFILKPVNLEGFVAALSDVKMYWPLTDAEIKTSLLLGSPIVPNIIKLPVVLCNE
jgi:two-component system response regulator